MGFLQDLKTPEGRKKVLVGNYDWKFLCIPRFPFFVKGKEYPPPPFYAHDEPLSLAVALMIGLQHALTMSTNIIMPALLIFNVVMSNFPETYNPASGEEQAANRERALDVAQYLVSASLICSGLGTVVQVSVFKIPFTNLQLGTGILSTMGTANQYNAIFPVILTDIISRGYDLNEAWGKLLGTIMLCVWLEAGIALLPTKVLKRVCPPFVLGVTVMLIGVQLTGAGIRFWGDGVGCSRNPSADSPCLGNGNVELGYGSGPYVALGFSVFIIFLFVEVFGSPFMQNTMVIWGLLGGYAIAALADHEGDSYVVGTRMEQSDVLTFLWVETFPIGIYGPTIIPMLFAFSVTAMETMGDVTAREHASRLRPTGASSVIPIPARMNRVPGMATPALRKVSKPLRTGARIMAIKSTSSSNSAFFLSLASRFCWAFNCSVSLACCSSKACMPYFSRKICFVRSSGGKSSNSGLRSVPPSTDWKKAPLGRGGSAGELSVTLSGLAGFCASTCSSTLPKPLDPLCCPFFFLACSCSDRRPKYRAVVNLG